MRTFLAAAPIAATLVAASMVAPVSAGQQVTQAALGPLEEAQRLFYSGRYDDAAARALSVRLEDPDNLAASELRTSALHFQIRRLLGTSQNKQRAWAACASCPELLQAFMNEADLARLRARSRADQDSTDENALFFLGKLNLNVVWLRLATLGQKTGWSEYREARKSLDAVLQGNPEHVRARVARAWIDYIVATKIPRGARWMFGGGNKERGLQAVREAAHANAAPDAQAEAMFALWDMQVRERHFADAVVTARALSEEFPENRELTKFIDTHDSRPTERRVRLQPD
jgi:hypothetical protein